MTILADYVLNGSGIQVRKLQGFVVLNAGAATQALPAEFTNLPSEWPVMATRNNGGTAEGELLAFFDPAGPEIVFGSTEVTDDANINFVMEVPTSLFG